MLPFFGGARLHVNTMSAKDEDEEQPQPKVMHPLIKDRLHRSRSVFAPGQRIRMNVLPMFMNIFVPWAFFISVLGLNAFWMPYSHPGGAYLLTALCIFFWLIAVLVAINRRKADPEPSWFSYFALSVGVAIFSAWALGTDIFNRYSLPYYEIKDLKVLGHVDASKERGQNVMDAGIMYFADGNTIDATRSWHFKQGSVYCVAPIIKGEPGKAVSETGSFDFWAVGKDCCAVSSSDFRCGAFANPLARSAIRVLGDEDRRMYRLAVEQAETLYGVMATHPIFFEWSQDPLAVVQSWNGKAFTTYVIAVIAAFVIALLAVSVASCKFAWLGRSDSVYGEAVYSDPDYGAGGYGSNPTA